MRTTKILLLMVVVFSAAAVVSMDPVIAAGVASGKPYSCYPAPSSNYPDSTNYELTDGTLYADWQLDRFVGWQGHSTVTITVYLGDKLNISSVKLHAGSWTSAGVYFPTSVTVSTSQDGKNYSNFGTISFPSNTSSLTTAWGSQSGAASSRRYVRFTVNTTSNWLFLDELEVYGSSGGSENSLLTGSFVIASDYASDQTGFSNFLSELQGLGMDTVILHSIGTVSSSGSATRTVSNSALGWMLNSAQSKGMKVYIGLYDGGQGASPYFWQEPVKSAVINASKQAVQEIESLYGNHSALLGYYVVQEASVAGHQLSILDDFYAPLISGIHEKSPKYVIAGGYLIVEENGVVKSTSAVQDWVHKFIFGGSGITGCNSDIFLLQDGIGSFDNPMSGYPMVTQYLQAAKNGASPRPFWDDVELFQWSRTKVQASNDNWYRPANTIRVNGQIYWGNQAGSNEKITWINQHHMSLVGKNRHGNEARHLYRGYRALYFDGGYYDNPSYSYSPQPSSSYPDSTGQMMFDNAEGQASWNKWVGWGQSTGSKATITVDLGSVKSVSDVTAVVRTETAAGIYYPSQLVVKYSTNGSSWYTLGSMNNPYSNQSAYSKAYLWVSANTKKSARYVKIELTHGGWWMFISELEVYTTK